MNRTIIKDFLKTPFKPFLLKMVDSQVFKIEDPDMLAVSSSQEIAIVFAVGHYHVLDSTKVSSIEVL